MITGLMIIICNALIDAPWKWKLNYLFSFELLDFTLHFPGLYSVNKLKIIVIRYIYINFFAVFVMNQLLVGFIFDMLFNY